MKKTIMIAGVPGIEIKQLSFTRWSAPQYGLESDSETNLIAKLTFVIEKQAA